MDTVLFSCGNAPGLPTGYGGQCLLAVRAFQRAGAKRVYIIAWNLQANQFAPFHEFTTEEVVNINPGMLKIFDAAGAHEVDWSSVFWFSNPYASWPATIQKTHINAMITKSNADLFVSLQDIFMFEPGAMLCLSAVWMPLHFVPVEHPTILALADFDIQLPISGWGAALLEPLQRGKHQERHVEVVAHGRCPKVYRPIWDDYTTFCAKNAQTRFKWGWPEDAWVVMLIASNSEESGRKAFDAQLQAFSKFRRTHPKAWLHIHAETVRAYDIPRLLEIFGETDSRSTWINESDQRYRTHADAPCSGTRVSVTPSLSLNSISEDEIADMYRASNALLAATCSEGCGVPILEAQMCGCPVVTTRATAMWEETLLGITVPPKQWIARMDFNSGWYLPDADGIATALDTLHGWNYHQRRREYEAIEKRLLALYSNDAIINSWAAVLTNIVAPSISSGFTHPKLEVSKKRKDFLRLAMSLRKDMREMERLTAVMSEEQTLLQKQAKSRDAVKYIESL
jgi:glycosyltransferase involved in cell wall biosynthesis